MALMEVPYLSQQGRRSVAGVQEHNNTRKEVEANAQAIAAVPSMLEALERVFRKLEHEEADGRLGHSSEYLMVKHALIKAGYTF